MRLQDLATPALCVDVVTLEANLASMALARPGRALRPHVKAHLCTRLAWRQIAHGHRSFACATAGELVGMAKSLASLDLLLANECLGAAALRELARVSMAGRHQVTVAVDSLATAKAAADAGLRDVLIDVNVGLPRCGCDPDEAGALADAARKLGLAVRGVMGYEGHVMGVVDKAERRAGCAESMTLLRRAHCDVGGDVVSAGGTGTFDCNDAATEIQAGSYALMDATYAAQGLPFAEAAFVLGTVISATDRDVRRGAAVNRERYYVVDAGTKCFGMDHGQPHVDGAALVICSDEHATVFPVGGLPQLGDRVRLRPAHIDPTVSCHGTLHLAEGERVVDAWPIDLRRGA